MATQAGACSLLGLFYDRLRYDANPFMGPFAQDLFADQGASIDYTRELVRSFFLALNDYWLTEFHVDGFRYDCVPNYWDGPLGVGYAKLRTTLTNS